MATLSLADLHAEVTARTQYTDIAEVDLTQDLEEILRDLSSRWPFLQKTSSVTVAASGNSIALPADYRTPIYGVTDPNDKSLVQVTYPDLLAFQGADSSDGTTIKRYAMFNNTLQVWPSPSAQTVLTVSHAFITGNTTTIDFSEEFEPALIQGLCWKAYEQKGQYPTVEASTGHKQSYEESIKTLIEEFKDRGVMA